MNRSYDDKQLGAVLISWLCCRRTVYATNPAIGCIQCQDRNVIIRRLS